MMNEYEKRRKWTYEQAKNYEGKILRDNKYIMEYDIDSLKSNEFYIMKCLWTIITCQIN